MRNNYSIVERAPLHPRHSQATVRRRRRGVRYCLRRLGLQVFFISAGARSGGVGLTRDLKVFVLGC